MTGCIREFCRRAWNGFLDLLFPRKVSCLLCGREVDDAYLCEECLPRLILNDGTRRCEKCSRPLIAEERFCPSCTSGERLHFNRAVSACVYEGAVVTMIHRFKLGRRREYAELFASLMAVEAVKLPDVDIVVPVPMEREKLPSRGYNQCDLLGKSLCSELNLPLKDALIRRSNTIDQVGLSARERRRNVRGSYKVVDASSVKGKNVLIVDDVLTTGATLSECARVLKVAGAKEVYAVTAAIAPTRVREGMTYVEERI